jgi:hypothetical protein
MPQCGDVVGSSAGLPVQAVRTGANGRDTAGTNSRSLGSSGHVTQTVATWQLRREPRTWRQHHALKKWDAQYSGVVSVVTGAADEDYANSGVGRFPLLAQHYRRVRK